MNKPSLSELYQSLTESQTLGARALIDTETAVRAARGRVIPHERDEVAAALAGSSAHADLVQFLRALEPESAQLAQNLAGNAAHESRERGRRSAQGRLPRRGLQWGAVAASLVAVIALFVMRGGHQSDDALQAQVRGADTIFDGRLENSVAHRTIDDRIFDSSAGDKMDQDRIFTAQVGG